MFARSALRWLSTVSQALCKPAAILRMEGDLIIYLDESLRPDHNTEVPAKSGTVLPSGIIKKFIQAQSPI